MGINITLFKWNGNIVPANLKDRTHKFIQKFTAHMALFTTKRSKALYKKHNCYNDDKYLQDQIENEHKITCMLIH